LTRSVESSSGSANLGALPRPAAQRRPLLVRRRAIRQTLDTESLDFQELVARPRRAAAAGEAAPACVFVLTRAADREIDQLSLQLAAAGIPLLRLDSDRAAGSHLSWDPETGALTTEQGCFLPRLVWWRYFTSESVAAGAWQAYAESQWAAWPLTLAGSRTASAINGGGGPGRPDRLSQLAAAVACGLRVPRAVVTTAPASALARLSAPRLVVKSLGEHYVEARPGRLLGLAPVVLTREALARVAGVEPAPVIVQELVAARSELRVFVVGRQLTSFRVQKPSPEAPWTDDASVTVEPVPTPKRLGGSLLRLARRFSLDVAAADVLETDRGPVFLELNAACDWLWFERRAGSRAVSTAVAELIRTRFGSAR
jgi:hypothetical protein